MGAAGVAGDARGDVQESVAEPFWFPAACRGLGQQESLCPGDQVLAREHELEPDRVGREGAERRLRRPLFGAADRVLDARTATVDLLEPRDAPAGLVGDEDLEAVPVVIGEGELRAGVRPFAADRARSLRSFLCSAVLGVVGDPVSEVDAEDAHGGAPVVAASPALFGALD